MPGKRLSPIVDDDAARDPRVAAARRAGDAARAVISRLVASRAPADDLDAAAAALGRVADLLAPHATRSRYDGTDGISFASPRDARTFEHHPLLGPANPLAPPLVAERDDDGVVTAAVTYDLRYEGMPGWVHGGVVAMALDLVLGMAAGGTAGRPTVTGTFTLRYRTPTPLWEPLVYRGWAEPRSERTLLARGTLHAADRLCVEAEGIWVVSRYDHVPPVPPDGVE